MQDISLTRVILAVEKLIPALKTGEIGSVVLGLHVEEDAVGGPEVLAVAVGAEVELGLRVAVPRAPQFAPLVAAHLRNRGRVRFHSLAKRKARLSRVLFPRIERSRANIG